MQNVVLHQRSQNALVKFFSLMPLRRALSLAALCARCIAVALSLQNPSPLTSACTAR